MAHLHFDSQISDFLKAVSPNLERNSTIHSFLLSLASTVHSAGKNAYFMVRHLDPEGALIGAGIQTEAIRPLIISLTNDQNARDLSRALIKKGISLPGINGPLPAVEAFAEEWRSHTACKVKLALHLRLFELTQVTPPAAPSGNWRVADSRDEAVLALWTREFITEAAPHDLQPSDSELRERIRERTQKECYFLWENHGAPVCLVGSTRETDRERWIAPVYTPREHRGQGYASALVAVVSQRFLDRGKKCMLFTDLANPTSNSIYQKVGYRPLADFKHLLFNQSNSQ